MHFAERPLDRIQVLLRAGFEPFRGSHAETQGGEDRF